MVSIFGLVIKRTYPLLPHNHENHNTALMTGIGNGCRKLGRNTEHWWECGEPTRTCCWPRRKRKGATLVSQDTLPAFPLCIYSVLNVPPTLQTWGHPLRHANLQQRHTWTTAPYLNFLLVRWCISITRRSVRTTASWSIGWQMFAAQ